MRNTQSPRVVAIKIMATKPGPWSGAHDSLSALSQFDSIEENGAREAVKAFLDSAKSWRGREAREYKRQLRSMIERD